MNRKVRIRRKPDDDEHKTLQNYLDKKVTEAMNPVLAAIYDLQTNVDAMKAVMLWVHRDLDGLMNTPDAWTKLPPGVRASLTGLQEKLNVLTWTGINDQNALATMAEDFRKSMATPVWLDEAMRDADNADLSGLMDDE